MFLRYRGCNKPFRNVSVKTVQEGLGQRWRWGRRGVLGWKAEASSCEASITTSSGPSLINITSLCNHLASGQLMTGHVKIQDIGQKVASDHKHHNSSQINNPATHQRDESLPMILQCAQLTQNHNTLWSSEFTYTKANEHYDKLTTAPCRHCTIHAFMYQLHPVLLNLYFQPCTLLGAMGI